jgi:hypothetical protein
MCECGEVDWGRVRERLPISRVNISLLLLPWMLIDRAVQLDGF